MSEENNYVQVGDPPKITATVTMTGTWDNQDCPACNGMGLQTRNDGIKIVCPVCDGCGKWTKPMQSQVCWTGTTYPLTLQSDAGTGKGMVIR